MVQSNDFVRERDKGREGIEEEKVIRFSARLLQSVDIMCWRDGKGQIHQDEVMR